MIVLADSTTNSSIFEKNSQATIGALTNTGSAGSFPSGASATHAVLKALDLISESNLPLDVKDVFSKPTKSSIFHIAPTRFWRMPRDGPLFKPRNTRNTRKHQNRHQEFSAQDSHFVKHNQNPLSFHHFSPIGKTRGDRPLDYSWKGERPREPQNQACERPLKPKHSAD